MPEPVVFHAAKQTFGRERHQDVGFEIVAVALDTVEDAAMENEIPSVDTDGTDGLFFEALDDTMCGFHNAESHR